MGGPYFREAATFGNLLKSPKLNVTFGEPSRSATFSGPFKLSEFYGIIELIMVAALQGDSVEI